MGTKYRGTDEDRIALDSFIKLSRACSSFGSYLEHAHRLPDGLTVSQFSVLEVLHHLGPITQGEICSKVLQSKGNITMVVDHLEKRRLVERIRSREDRRKIHVNLTDEGRSVIGEIFPDHVRAIREGMSVLRREERLLLGELCKKLGLGVREKS